MLCRDTASRTLVDLELLEFEGFGEAGPLLRSLIGQEVLRCINTTRELIGLCDLSNHILKFRIRNEGRTGLELA
jgi:hypothetical protein